MALQDFGHDCDRFRAQGLACPFSRFDVDEDEVEGEDDTSFKFIRPFPGPERRRLTEEQENAIDFAEAVQRGQIREFLDRPVFPAKDPRFQRELERIGAIQSQEGLPSLPNLGFPFGGSMDQAIVASLAAIAIMKALGALRSGGLGNLGRAVAVSEKRAASLLKGVAPTRVAPRGGPAGGGFHMRAPTFRRILNAPKLRKRRNGAALAFGQEFNETGF